MKYYVSEEEYRRLLEKIAEWAGDRDFTSIFAIPKGGRNMGEKLSALLGIPLLERVEEITARTLVVDDKSHKGTALLTLDGKLQERGVSFRPSVAVLVCCRSTARRPDYFGREDDYDDWAIFPWETEENSKYDGTFV